MVTAAAGFHITLYSVPPMRRQRRRSAALRCSRGRSSWRTVPGRDHRAHSPGELIAASFVAALRPAVQPAGSREDQQHTTIPAPTLVPQGGPPRVDRSPSDRSARRDFVPVVGCGFAPHISDTPREASAKRCRGGPSSLSDERLCDRSPRVAGYKVRPGTAAHSLRSLGYRAILRPK
jgi:hypothetical protein